MSAMGLPSSAGLPPGFGTVGLNTQPSGASGTSPFGMTPQMGMSPQMPGMSAQPGLMGGMNPLAMSPGAAYGANPMGQAMPMLGQPPAAAGAKIQNLTLRRGMRGAQVRALQTALRQLGMYKGRSDGKYDADVQRAVRAFQKKAGGNLRATGIANPATRRAMQKALLAPHGAVLPDAATDQLGFSPGMPNGMFPGDPMAAPQSAPQVNANNQSALANGGTINQAVTNTNTYTNTHNVDGSSLLPFGGVSAYGPYGVMPPIGAPGYGPAWDCYGGMAYCQAETGFLAGIKRWFARLMNRC